MLEPAILHKDELIKKDIGTWYDDRYKYFHINTYHEIFKPAEDDWNYIQMVSIDPTLPDTNKVCGYFFAHVNRASNVVKNIGAINFYLDRKLTFGKDLKQFLESLFLKFNFKTITFDVAVGNPIEKSYDKLVKHYNGRIVGTFEKNYKIADGTYVDIKWYQVNKEYFLKAINKGDNKNEEENL